MIILNFRKNDTSNDTKNECTVIDVSKLYILDNFAAFSLFSSFRSISGFVTTVNITYMLSV